MVVTVLNNGKLLKPQTINDEGKVVDYFAVKKTEEFGVTSETAGPEPTDFASLENFFDSHEAYLEALKRG